MTRRPLGAQLVELLAGVAVAAAIVAVPVALGGLGRAAAEPAASEGPTAETLRLGYLPNVTHAAALAGLETGLIADALGGTALEPQAFAAGPAVVEALSAGAIDAAYLGPNPAVNSFVQSGGASIRIVAGAASGGAALVVRDGIADVDDLRGATLATPQLGNTQDVALRSWLDDHGLTTSPTGGGDVDIVPTDNASTLKLFRAGALDGAWLPEPWVSRLVLEAGAEVLVDEGDLWPGGEYPTTVLAVRAEFLAEQPDTVRALVAGHVASVDWIVANPEDVADVVNTRLAADAGARLPDGVIARALDRVVATVDPFASTFPVLQDAAVATGTARPGDLDGLFDLRALNHVLADRAREPVSAAGLGAER